MAIVGSHQVSPDIGLISLVAIDSGRFSSSVCPKCEVEPRIFGDSRFHSPNAYRPALLTQWMGTVVKYTYSTREMGEK